MGDSLFGVTQSLWRNVEWLGSKPNDPGANRPRGATYRFARHGRAGSGVRALVELGLTGVDCGATDHAISARQHLDPRPRKPRLTTRVFAPDSHAFAQEAWMPPKPGTSQPALVLRRTARA